MPLSTFSGNRWIPSTTKNTVCVKITSLFCVLTACLVILFGCADPGHTKEERRGGCDCYEENQNRLVYGFVACGTVAEGPGYFHG